MPLKKADPKTKPRKVQQCRICACTQENACPGGCSWVDASLCDRCVLTSYHHAVMPRWLWKRIKESAKAQKLKPHQLINRMLAEWIDLELPSR